MVLQPGVEVVQNALVCPGPDSNGVGIVPRLQLRYDPVATCRLGGSRSAYIRHIESVSGGGQASDFHFFMYATKLAAKWRRLGVSRGGDWLAAVR